MLTQGPPQVRIGDMGLCSCDNKVTVMTGSMKAMAAGPPAARIGDKMSCGGVIITGATKVLIGG